MSHETDYDKQFQLDLEKAQALSLESLALEKFRMKKKLEKLQTQLNKYSNSTSDSSTVATVSSTKPCNESSRSEQHQLKSRPRPGSFNTGQSHSIIAPPPTSQRRNSSTPSTATEETDLISFTSPTQTSIQPQKSQDSLKDFCDQIHLLTQQQSEMSLVEKNPRQQILNLSRNNNNISPFTTSLFTSQQSPTVLPPLPFINRFLQQSQQPPTPPSYGFQPHITAGLNLMSGIAPLNSGYQYPPTVPQIPPLPSNYLPRVEPPKLDIPAITSTSNVDVFKVISKQDNSNLIDLASGGATDENRTDKKNNVRVSVLEIFDPLLTDRNSNKTTDSSTPQTADDAASECSGSMYNEYDPFDYLYTSGSGVPSNSDPIYAAVVRSDKTPQSPQSPPPLPPRAVWSTLEKKRKSIDVLQTKRNRLYENITVVKRKSFHHDSDLRAFYTMVKDIRGRFVYSDLETNPGVIISPMISNVYRSDTSIKLVVHPTKKRSNINIEEPPKPISFTCDVSCSVEHVILHVLCELDEQPEDAHRLEVWGAAEYLAPGTCLADYEYVHHCIKLEQDVVFSLVPEYAVDCSLSRTAQDDRRDFELTIDDLLPNEPGFPISHEKLKILLEIVEREIERLETAAVESANSTVPTSTLHSSGVVQAVKAVCMLMGMIETPDISEAVDKIVKCCAAHNFSLSDYNSINKDLDLVETIKSSSERIRAAIQGLIEMYCQAFRVDFQLNYKNELATNSLTVSDVLDTILVHACALHRVPNSWKHNDYLIAAQIYHGTRPVGQPILSSPTPITQGFYPRILFNSWLDMEGISVCQLARESRIVLVLYGRTLVPTDKDDINTQPKYTQEELGWASIQFFDYNGMFTQGNLLVSLWPSVTDKRLGPAPCAGSHPLPDHPLLNVELPSPAGKIIFPSTPPQSPNNREPIGDFACLDENTQQQLLDLVEMDIFSRPPVECREVLWEKRHYLRHLPEALPKVLLAAHSWDWACLADLHYMVHKWTPMQPVQALQLLLPCFPDMEVRRCAVNWIKSFTNDELADVLPQLVQALKHETYEASALARLLLERALTSPRVAHNLYWLLTHSLPGSSPQNSQWDTVAQDEYSVGAARHYRRLMLMLRALLAISGDAQRQRFMSQQLLVKSLNEVAESVKSNKESLRLKTLLTSLEPVHQTLSDNPTCLPLSPSLLVNGIQVRTCSYFASNTLPLKVNFTAPNNNAIIPAIFKVGDDLQQDMLTLQVVRIMDKLWLREGLDLKMVSFGCVPTGHKRGMIELVGNAEPLRKIQIEWGLTGSFKDKPIAEWLARHNPSELEYERAVENFTASCAGYSVVTYILGICDRHNDNIMLKTSGHVFHIDFGKFLGDAQMFGNFKRDRTPFVLTSDMAYVINGGDRPSARFHQFVDLCCQAYNIVRKHGNLILHLFALMASSGIPGVTMEAVNYVRRALLPGQSNAEAAATFARLIESSLKSWFTQFNFFLHNLAQLRFTGDHGDGELLSFVPKVFSMTTDGRLLGVEVQGYQKRYDPDKHYLYIIKVERVGSPDSSYVLRSYREFTELYQKLCLHFPLAKVHSLPTGMHMGRSNIKQVAAKRKADIELFLKSLFQTADEIAHSDLVYTFFHPLLRDQQPVDLFARKLKERRTDQRSDIGRVKGELKLSVIYERGALSVMVQHARSLPLIANGQEPSTYVKVYLQPDATKATKRKTKVVRRSCHPSFMEMLEYRLPLDLIKQRVLQATLWSYDPLQENEFLGGVELRLGEMPLEREETHWFPLVNITR